MGVSRSVVEVSLIIVVAMALVVFARDLVPENSNAKKKAAELDDPLRTTIKHPEGLTAYNTSKSFAGVTVLPFSEKPLVKMISMDGEILKQWPVLAARFRILPNCNLLINHKSAFDTLSTTKRKVKNKISEYTWDGKLVWEYKAPSYVHHDVRRLSNGATQIIHGLRVPQKIIDTKTTFSLFKNHQIDSDTIMEVDRSGKTLFEWTYHEHFAPGDCGAKKCSSKTSHHTAHDPGVIDWTHTNTINSIPSNKWFDAGHTAFKPGNILFSPRNWNVAYIVDRDTKEIVWEYSGDYRGGIEGTHDVQMIEKGLPGAGNILLFDNGDPRMGLDRHSGDSFVLEVDPTTKKTVWVYDVGNELYSRSRSAVQRLPNGNTFVSSDKRGRAFEITPEKEIVWQYGLGDEMGRAGRYSFDHCPKLKDFQST